jgi:hypothetical protein
MEMRKATKREQTVKSGRRINSQTAKRKAAPLALRSFSKEKANAGASLPSRK